MRLDFEWLEVSLDSVGLSKLGICDCENDAANPLEQRYIKDPILLWHNLNKGNGLTALINSITGQTDEEISDLVHGSNTRTRSFLSSCNLLLGFHESDLFSIEDLQTFSIDSFNRVLDGLIKFLKHPTISEKIKENQGQAKAIKMQSMAGNVAPFTADDFVRKVLEELLTTEANYVKDLESIVSSLVKPLEAKLQVTGSGSRTSEDDETMEFFALLDKIHEFHQTFSSRLQSIGTNIETIGEIGLTFDEFGPKFIPLYQRYCVAHSDWTEKLSELKQPDMIALLGVIFRFCLI